MFSVLISTYFRDDEAHLKQALISVLHQSFLPEQIVLVIDGRVSESSEAVISEVSAVADEKSVEFFVLQLEKNVGLGEALRLGLVHCKCEYVVRMDADDISVFDRFSYLNEIVTSNPEYDIVGSWIEEFDKEPGDLSRIRSVPSTHGEIVRFSKLRNPMNHVTVCFKKQAVSAAGGYEALLFHEDYILWLKLLSKGAVFYNDPSVHVYVRVGNDLGGRRSGVSYFFLECDFVKVAIQRRYINLMQGIRYLAVRAPIRVLPKKLVELVYSCLR